MSKVLVVGNRIDNELIEVSEVYSNYSNLPQRIIDKGYIIDYSVIENMPTPDAGFNTHIVVNTSNLESYYIQKRIADLGELQQGIEQLRHENLITLEALAEVYEMLLTLQG